MQRSIAAAAPVISQYSLQTAPRGVFDGEGAPSHSLAMAKLHNFKHRWAAIGSFFHQNGTRVIVGDDFKSDKAKRDCACLLRKRQQTA
jgi:hypothetical protein